ncbi:MAG: hypothetical protein SNJ77_06015 [Cytophagales bacterium]
MKMGQEDIYDSFARLMYSIAMVDGTVEKEEKNLLKQELGDHAAWPFVSKYFESSQQDVYSLVESYKELIEACKDFGYSEDYPVFINVLEKLEKISGDDEDNLVKSFLESLKERLLNKN